MTYYKGLYKPRNTDKYLGNVSKLNYRSFWERAVMVWCDINPQIKKWAFECVIANYFHPIENRVARYIVDFLIIFENGKEILVEIKPKDQTVEPAKPERRSRAYENKLKTWLINQAKWEAAKILAESNSTTFHVWTEETLNKLNILHLGTPLAKPVKKQLYIEKQLRKKQIVNAKYVKPTVPKSVRIK